MVDENMIMNISGKDLEGGCHDLFGYIISAYTWMT
jgi:hypothetical protein